MCKHACRVGRCEWKEEEVKLQSRNLTWSLKLGCQKLNWEDYETIFAITLFCVWKEVTGNISCIFSCIFKFRVLLWGIEVLKTGDGRSESLSETQEGTEGSRRSHVDAVGVCCLSWAVDMQD